LLLNVFLFSIFRRKVIDSRSRRCQDFTPIPPRAVSFHRSHRKLCDLARMRSEVNIPGCLTFSRVKSTQFNSNRTFVYKQVCCSCDQVSS
jgi:hypothetical protein